MIVTSATALGLRCDTPGCAAFARLGRMTRPADDATRAALRRVLAGRGWSVTTDGADLCARCTARGATAHG